MRNAANPFIVFGLLLLLTGCNAVDRLSNIGGAPKMDPVEDPTAIANKEAVNMPMPDSEFSQHQPNSLWKKGSRAFFRDQRASRVGDILTVIVDLNEKAQISNKTKRDRTNAETGDASSILGFESDLTDLLGDNADASSLVDTASDLSNEGTGSVDRSEKVQIRIAAIIVQVLPNGNLVLAGKQQMTINYDMRELQISGIVRPEDVHSDNTITYDKIAEARLAYGGEGMIQDVQQPRYGSQVLDVIMPF